MDKTFDIFEYDLNGKKYIAYSDDNEIKFGIKNENSIDNNLSEKEKFIISNIYNFIVGDKKKILELSPVKYNNVSVGVLYNTENRLYSFYQVSDGKLTNLDKYILMSLNCLFNDQNIFLTNDVNDNNCKNKFKIMVKIGGVLTAVFVSASLVLSSLPIVPNNVELFKLDYAIDSLYKDRLATEQNEKYSYNEFISIINNNNNLTEEEKDFLIKSLKNEIEENIEYIDISQLKRNLSELKILYHNKYEYTPFVGNVKGRYIAQGPYRNQIDLYGDDTYITNNFGDCDESTLVHECNHLLNKRSFLLTLPGSIGNTVEVIRLAIGIDKGGAMEEMVNELFSREYNNDFLNKKRTNGYSQIMPVMYALCEILDEDTLRKYKFDSDYFYIVNYLETLGIDKTYVHDLYNCLELSNGNQAVLSETAEHENNKKIYNIIKYCYETKYGIPMEDDLVLMSYFYNTRYVDEEFNKRYKECLGVENILGEISPKGYISENYKNKHPNVTIAINELETITLTEENRYLNTTSKLK